VPSTGALKVLSLAMVRIKNKSRIKKKKALAKKRGLFFFLKNFEPSLKLSQ